MKKSYYRKSSRARSFRKKSKGSTLLSKQLAVIYNPFSTATDTPKVPDGQCVNSLGERLNFVTELDKAAVGDTAPESQFVMEALLSASMKTPISVAKSFKNDTAVVHFNNTGTFASTIPDGGNWIQKLTEASQIRKVRVVSMGYRFSLMNNADNNEGWFMAARNDSVSQGIQYKDPQDCNGFVAGKLRDIHKYQFTLQPNGREFPFLPNPPGGTTGHDPEINTTIVANTYLSTSGFDTISVKFSGGKDTKLMVHISANIEFTITNGGALYRYQTTCLAYPNVIDKILPKLRADVRAAVPFTGSFPLA